MFDYKLLVGLAIAVVIVLLLKSSRRKPVEVFEGGIYSAIIGREKTGENIYGIIKVLRYEDHVVHSRIYKNRFKERPASVDTSTLALGTIHDKDGQGLGHAPLSERMFNGMVPVLLIKNTVQPDELEGYKVWKESKGGVFDLGR